MTAQGGLLFVESTRPAVKRHSTPRRRKRPLARCDKWMSERTRRALAHGRVAFGGGMSLTLAVNGGWFAAESSPSHSCISVEKRLLDRGRGAAEPASKMTAYIPCWRNP